MVANHLQIVFGVRNEFEYTNHRGETSVRKMIPCNLWYGVSNADVYGTEPQWFLECVAVDRNYQPRTLALKNIKVK